MMLLTHNVLFLNSTPKPSIRVRCTPQSQFLIVLPLVYVKLWSAVRRREPLRGYLLFLQNSMGLHFIRLTLLMPYIYVMAGIHHIYHLTVFAAKLFQFLMLLAVCTVPFPSSTIMMYEIWPQSWCQRSAIMFKLNLTSSPWVVNHFITSLQCTRMILELILELLASGTVTTIIPFWC